MAEILKKTEEYRVNTEEEAEAFIAQAKVKANEEGYEVVSYQSTHKEKKSKGEVIDSYYIVKIVKQW